MLPKSCPSCGEVLIQKGVRPVKPGFSEHTLECESCGKIERVIVDNRFV